MKKRLSALFGTTITVVIMMGAFQVAGRTLPYCYDVCLDPETPLGQTCHCLYSSQVMNCFGWLNCWCLNGDVPEWCN